MRAVAEFDDEVAADPALLPKVLPLRHQPSPPHGIDSPTPGSSFDGRRVDDRQPPTLAPETFK